MRCLKGLDPLIGKGWSAAWWSWLVWVACFEKNHETFVVDIVFGVSQIFQAIQFSSPNLSHQVEEMAQSPQFLDG